MNALDVLEWICRESINGESLFLIDVPEEGENEWEQNDEWWMNMLGGVPAYPMSEGKYMYYFDSDNIGSMVDGRGAYTAPDALIEVPHDNGFDYIYLYRLDEERQEVKFDAIEYNQKTLKEWMED